MAVWSAASWQGPPDSNYDGPTVECRGLVLHIAEGSYEGTIGWMKNPISDVSSHFVIARDGRIAQMLDTAVTAWTQAAGNGHWVSVENEGFSTQGFTDEQSEANAQLYAWLLSTHGVPAQLADSPSETGLGWHGMGGVAWGNHPNCLPLDSTEVLTPTGWLPLEEVSMKAKIASLSVDSGILTFDPPVAIVGPYRADTVSVGGFEMTADHRLYVHRSDGGSKKILTAEEVGRVRTNWLIPCFGQLACNNRPDGPGPDLLRLLVWTQADGHYEDDGGRLPVLHFHLTKKRKVERILNILERLNVHAKVVVRTDGTTSIRVRDRHWLQENVISWLPRKYWDYWLVNLTDEEFTAFDEEIHLADGTQNKSQRFYFTSLKENADAVQALYVTHGRAASIYVNANGSYVVNLHTRRKALSLRDSFHRRRADVTVGCLTTVNDTILIRQNGRVAIVGNCPGSINVAKRSAILARAVQINGGNQPLDGGAMSYTVRSGDADGSIYLVPGGLAPSGKIAAFPIYGAEYGVLPQVQLPSGVSVLDAGLYDVNPQPWPSGGPGGGPSLAEITATVRAELNKTKVPSVPGQLGV